MSVPIGESFSFGWQVTKSNFFFFIGVFIILIIFGAAAGVTDFVEQNTPGGDMVGFLALVLDISFVVINMVLGLGITRISLIFCEGRKPGFLDLFKPYVNVWQYFVASILVVLIILMVGLPFGALAYFYRHDIKLFMPALAVTGGLLLIYISLRYLFISYAIVDGDVGPVASLRISTAVTRGEKFGLILFFLAAFGVNLIGVLLLGLGLLFTIPMTMVATAYVYRHLALQARVPLGAGLKD